MSFLKSILLSPFILVVAFNVSGQSTWTVRTSGTTNNLYGVTGSGNQVAAVGFGSTVLSSSDGVTWNKRVSGTSGATMETVVWTGNKFLAGGTDPAQTSPDGITW